ncbi:MAG: hypothetical protein ACRDZR_13610 [Acidimicrobiales bacterium]
MTRRTLRVPAELVALVLVLLLVPAAAGTASAAPGHEAPIGITVSFPPTTAPVLAYPGATAESTFDVTNNEDAPVGIHVLQGNVIVGDNGDLVIKPGVDKRFRGDVSWTPTAFTAAPRSTTVVHVHVDVPQLAPGIYVLGLLVRPDVTSRGIAVVNQIGALVTLQTPGPTTQKIAARFVNPPDTRLAPLLPALQLSTSGRTTLRVTDVGTSPLYSFSQVTLASSPGGATVRGHAAGAPAQLRAPVHLYFPGRYRNTPVAWTPGSLGIGAAHVSALVYAHGRNGALTSVRPSTHVLVVSPWWLLVICGWYGLLLGLLLARLRADRRRAAAVAAGRRAGADREEAGRRDRASSIVAHWAASAVLAFLAVELAWTSTLWVFALVAGAGILAAGGAAARIRAARLAPEAALRLAARWPVGGLAAVVVAGAVLVCVEAATSGSFSATLAVLAAGAVWLVACRWLARWAPCRPPAPSAGGGDAHAEPNARLGGPGPEAGAPREAGTSVPSAHS